MSWAKQCLSFRSGKWLTYGPGTVVRYGPNTLSFSTLQSYKDIYGHASKGREPFRKGLWYRSFNVDGKPGLASETDIAVHRQSRRDLAHAFSAVALREQTYIARKYIDSFVGQVARYGQTDKGIGIDEWFMWLTFDVIGDLAFGEPVRITMRTMPGSYFGHQLISHHYTSLGLSKKVRIQCTSTLTPH